MNKLEFFIKKSNKVADLCSYNAFLLFTLFRILLIQAMEKSKFKYKF